MSNARDAAEKLTEGRRLLNTHEYEAAATVLTEALELNPNLTHAYQIRSDAYRRLGRIAAADADLEKAPSQV